MTDPQHQLPPPTTTLTVAEAEAEMNSKLQNLVSRYNEYQFAKGAKNDAVDHEEWLQDHLADAERDRNKMEIRRTRRRLHDQRLTVEQRYEVMYQKRDLLFWAKNAYRDARLVYRLAGGQKPDRGRQYMN
jgi:hypothetical protein